MILPLEGSTATPHGLPKLAAAPVLSAEPWLPPASVVTLPRGVASLMRLLPVSATTITPLDGITATPCGWLKLAAAPPASVVAMPEEGSTIIMRLLFLSATTIMPLDGTTATPIGMVKPVASVETTPRGVTSRTQLLPESATTIAPEGITATPAGLLKDAAAPVPSVNAANPLPASVVTIPKGVTSRMRWFFSSLTTIAPLEGDTATPYGPLKLAPAPVPSANPWPLPASVVMTPTGVTSRMRLLP
jgi:hypothetical protein